MVSKQFSLKNIGERIVEKAVDAVLLLIYFNIEAPFLTGTGRRNNISDKISEDLETFDYQSLKRALIHLKKKGFVNKEINCLPKITQSGEKRLKHILPVYDDKRIWDKKIYLVIYDIPETKSKIRDYLRIFLKKIQCGMLQQSVWLTPYNPTKHMRQFINDRSLNDGLILVSSIGKNGAVGQMTLSALMESVYKLAALNQRYLKFIEDCKNGKTTKLLLLFSFLSILKDDPQIPFSLLPDYWVGDKAYQTFTKLYKNDYK